MQAAVTFPTFSGRVISQSTGLPGVQVVLEALPGQSIQGSVVMITDSTGKYSGTFGVASPGGIKWRFTFTKDQHTFANQGIMDVNVVETSGNVTLKDMSVEIGPITGVVRSGSFPVPGVVVFPTNSYSTLYTSSSLNIPDGVPSGTNFFTAFGAPGQLSNAQLTLGISHPNIADLEIRLTHPDGTSVLVRNHTGSGPFTGTLVYDFSSLDSFESLSALAGKSINGRWTLNIRDTTKGNSGSLTSGNLRLSAAAAISDANGAWSYGLTRELLALAPTNSAVLTWSFPAGNRALPGIPSTINVATAKVQGRISPLDDQLTGNFMTNIQIAVTQPSTQGNPPAWASVNSSGVFDATTRTSDQGASFQFLPLSGTEDVTLTPSAPGYTFSPASITTYAGNSNVTFSIVASPPLILGLTDKTILEDTSLSSTFSVMDLQSVSPYSNVSIVDLFSSNPLLVTNSYGGLTATRNGSGPGYTLKVVPVPNANGTARVFIVASDGILRSTNSFLLTVQAAADSPVAGSSRAIAFNGSNAYIAVLGGAIPTSGDFTIEAWAFAPSSAGGTREIFSQGTSGNAFYLGFSGSSIRAGDGWLPNVGVNYPFDGWHHFAVVKSDAGAFLYIDGEPRASKASIPNPSNTEFRIGRQYGANGEYWLGSIDEVRIWSTARTDSDIRRTMTSPLSGTEAGLMAYYRMEEGSGVYAFDSAPNLQTQAGPQHGTFVNAPTWASNTGINNGKGLMSYLIGEDTRTPLYLPGLDVDGDPVTTNLTFTMVSLPLHGTLTPTTGAVGLTNVNPVAFTPTANYVGPDSFTYRVSDGVNLSTLVTASLFVTNVNDIPEISAIADQLIVEDTTNIVNFTVRDSDPDQVQSALDIRVQFVAGGSVRIATNWVTSAQGTNRTLYIVPAPGEIGNVRVTVIVTDTPRDTASTTFELAVVAKPAYAIRDIGTLPGYTTSFGYDINELGLVAGAAGLAGDANTHAFRFNGILDGGSISAVGPGFDRNSTAYGINDAGDVVGVMMDANKKSQAFRTSQGTATPLGYAVVGDYSLARSINAQGDIAGVGNTNVLGTFRALIYTNNVWAVAPSGATNAIAEANAINNSGQLAGTMVTNGAFRAVIFDGTNRLLAPLVGGATNSFGFDINNAGMLVGSMTVTGVSKAFRWQPGSNPELLGDLTAGGSGVAYGVNTFGQTVGTAVGAGGTSRAILRSAGTLHDLNDLMQPDANWVLEEARAINNGGWITGTGSTNGQRRAFLAVPAWVIGRKIARPLGAIADAKPDIELIERFTPSDTPENAFYWSISEGRLYGIRPVTARVRWRIRQESGDTNRITTIGMNVWPRVPTYHVAGSPSEVQPQGTDLPYTYRQLMFTTAPGSSVDPSAALFTAVGTGYSVLRYVRSDGLPPDETTQFPAFDVVRTVLWDDPAHLEDNVPTFVGDTLSHRKHFDYLQRQGHVFFEYAFYDGVGTDRAYDRPTRQGSIIPVNVPTSSTGTPTNQMVVIWYQTNRLGVAWSGLPVRYKVEWPENTPNRISIANGLGSGPLETTLYPNQRVYVQPVQGLPGYNPNEEHALMTASSVGGALYALRTDLNASLNASEPYSLLKYRDPGTGLWRIRTYKVVFDGDPVFTGKAGDMIQPPLPLSGLIPLCGDSEVIQGPGWKSYNGTLFARSAGLEGTHTNIVVHWWYPLQVGFYYPADQPISGNCVPWFTQSEGKSHRVDAIYDIRWPDDAAILNVGESVMTPKRGLPGVTDWVDASIIYDDIDPTDSDPLKSMARFYDPISPRSVTLPDRAEFDAKVHQQLIEGKVYFPDLPYALKRRLTYDPGTRELTFAGVLDDSPSMGGPDNPLLLPNVISPKERQTIAKTVFGKNGVNNALDELFFLTRNPNGVDISPADGKPDRDLRLGLIMDGTHAVPQRFPAGTKALTAGLGSIPSAVPKPGKALSFDATSQGIALTDFNDLPGDFTISLWAKVNAGNTGSLITNTAPGGGYFRFVPQATQFVISDRPTAGASSVIPRGVDANWHHLALVREGTNLTVLVDASPIGSVLAQNLQSTSGFRLAQGFQGQIDEFQIWNVALSPADLFRMMRKQRYGTEKGLLVYFRFDEGQGTSIVSPSLRGVTGTFAPTGITWVASTAPAAIPPRFITLAENNDRNHPELVTALKVIRIDEGPALGDLKVLPSDNVFDERVTLRHSGDFGGAPELLTFEWYYHEDDGSDVATILPEIDSQGEVTTLNGWKKYTVDNGGLGFNDITLGEGPRNGLLTMSDCWFVCRYKGYTIDQQIPWSGWVGQPGGGRAQLVEGWIKRVLNGLNPFEQRTEDFHSNPTATYVNMLTQAGRRYEGPVAFNPDPNFLNNVGLIEAYTTVLDRGKSLSVDGTPPVNFGPANNALLLAAGRLADLSMMLGNEAYADSTDPTIGFATDGSGGTDYGVFASSIFAFQNQLDSLLQEELVLLRGRDDSSASVRIPPVYNRLYWNFTRGDGELAYAQSYNIIDVNFDGFVNVDDAATMFPQGHGDAWGHYLTALGYYYDLLQNTNYTWVPRSESVRVGAAAIEVDYLDERKFARAAAAKAKAGAEIVNLTYRQSFVDDPAGQYQGYKDTDPDRAWGLFEWAQRARQGSYLDWLTANTILPYQDPDPSHEGISKIDRTTVSEIREIAANADTIQTELDKADLGLNPLGLGKGVVPFDIDPNFLEIGSGTQGKTHFDQIYDRAEKAMNNAMNAFNNANQLTTALRRQQDSDVDFARNVNEQERDYKSRLIEIFGYPYAGDIGVGKTYPADYDGPDLYHYMYANASDISAGNSIGSSSFTNLYNSFQAENGSFGYYFPQDAKSRGQKDKLMPVLFPVTLANYSLLAPASWGQRRAPGEIQQALSDLIQADAGLKISLANYDSLIKQAQDAVDLLEAQYALTNTVISALSSQATQVASINSTIKNWTIASMVLRRAGSIARDVSEVAGIRPKDLDDIFAVDATILAAAALGVAEGVEAIADGFDGDIQTQELSKENLELTTGLKVEAATQSFETLQRLKEVQQIIRSEPAARLEASQLAETVRQAAGRYRAAIAAGNRILQERLAFRKYTAGDIQDSRYQDMTFRVFRNDAVQKYRAQFDLAARYVYLAAMAYDYETQLLGTQNGSGREFLTQIVRERSLGVMQDGEPVVGQPGLSDSLGRLRQNFDVLKGQLGLTTSAQESGKFSLRREMLRIQDDEAWRQELQKSRVADLWQVPEFRRYCRPFAPEAAGPQPGLVLRFSTTVNFGLNYFGWPLGGGDSSYDPTYFATKIRSAGIWFDHYDGSGLSKTPRVYLVPVGIDVLRSPTDNSLATREWKVLDQKIPPPFTLGKATLQNPTYIPINDSLSGVFAEARKFSSIRAYHDSGDFDESEAATDTRLIGRSVWNTQWMLIIPGGTLLFNPDQGLNTFINSVDDIRLFFQTYSYSGN